jgi:hypothetical protein
VQLGNVARVCTAFTGVTGKAPLFLNSHGSVANTQPAFPRSLGALPPVRGERATQTGRAEDVHAILKRRCVCVRTR